MIGSQPSRPPFPVTLDNWQSADQLVWTFQHMSEIFPTATIGRGDGPVVHLPSRPVDLGTVSCLDPDGVVRTVADVMVLTQTDGWMVVRDGVVLAEHYPGGMEASTPHLLMSVSKSVVGTVIGALVGQGLVDVEAPVTA